MAFAPSYAPTISMVLGRYEKLGGKAFDKPFKFLSYASSFEKSRNEKLVSPQLLPEHTLKWVIEVHQIWNFD